MLLVHRQSASIGPVPGHRADSGAPSGGGASAAGKAEVQAITDEACRQGPPGRILTTRASSALVRRLVAATALDDLVPVEPPARAGP